MKPEKICDALGQLGEDILAEADAVRKPIQKKKIPWAKLVSLAASIGLILLGVWLVYSMPSGMASFTVEAAEYPAMARYPEFDPNHPEAHEAYCDAWNESRMAIRPDRGYADGLESYFSKTIAAFLAEAERENRVFSPLSLYMALSMAAETTDGDSREQILALIGKESLESLRAQANNVWRSAYSNDGATTSVMANSLWFNENFRYNPDTVKTIAEHYYAGVYHGRMASEQLNEAMREWLNEQTGGLLKESVAEVGVEDPNTIMTMFSTVNYRAKWQTEFNPKYTENGVFYTPSGEMNADFMYRTMEDNYYWSENFAAVCLRLENSGWMWLVLPDENVSMDTLLEDERLYTLTLSNGSYLSSDEWAEQKRLIIHLRMPKFDVASDFSLTEGLHDLGVTDMFDAERADLSPLTEDIETFRADNGNPYYASAKQAARVAVDEEGVVAAAYTEMPLVGAAPTPDEEVEFTLDRPFFFAISHSDGLPLFTGIVNIPQ